MSDGNEIAMEIDEISTGSNDSVISQEKFVSASSQKVFKNLDPSEYRVLQTEELTGRRQNSKLLFAEGYLYSFNAKMKSHGESWLCSHLVGRKRVCKVRVYKENDMCIQLLDCGEHNHGNKIEEKNQLKVLNEVKRRCANWEDVLAPARVSVRDIWDQVLRK